VLPEGAGSIAEREFALVIRCAVLVASHAS
jgi:hypothetical protein